MLAEKKAEKVVNPARCMQLSKQFLDFHPNFDQHLHFRALYEANKEIRRKFDGMMCCIDIPISELKKDDTWIKCEGFFGYRQFTCIASCGFWHKIKPTPREITTGYIRLFDHLHELVPKPGPNSGNKIAFFTFQNGINNNFDDFLRMGQAILTNLPEKPLCLGIYKQMLLESSKNWKGPFQTQSASPMPYLQLLHNSFRPSIKTFFGPTLLIAKGDLFSNLL